jgi:tetratricopeptide (TPR) repeat protein
VKKNNLGILVACILSIIASYSFASSSAYAQQLTPEKQQEVDALSQQIKANPNDYALYVKRGFIYKKGGRESAANFDFEHALMLNSQWQQGYILRAEKLKRERKVAEALEEFNKAEKVARLNAPALTLRAGLYWDLKNYAAAQKDYTTAISQDPLYAPAYSARGALTLETNGNSAEASADLEKTLSLNPTDAISRQLLEEIHNKKNK